MPMFVPVTDVTARMPSMAIPLHRRAAEAPTLMNTNNQLRPENAPRAVLDGGLGQTSGGGPGRTYDEETFRYFLSVEEERSHRSSRPLLLLLVDLKKEDPGMPGTRFEHGIAGQLFTALWACLRETDFVGWYLDGQVAGAVLTHIGDTAQADVSALISQRVGNALRGSLPPRVASRLRVLVHQLPTATDGS
jgi:hypothetical protein